MAELIVSNKKLWRYNLVWDKFLPSGFLNAKRQAKLIYCNYILFKFSFL
jgi:hypothetical protein